MTDTRVELLLSTGKPRRVDRWRLENGWHYLEREGYLSRDQIQKDISPRSSAYLSAILAEMSGVTYACRPLTLRLATR